MKDKTFVFLFALFIFGVFVYNSLFDLSGDIVGYRFCYDTDDGIMAYTPGQVVSDIGNFNDRCFDNLNEIREYYCTEGRYGGQYQVGSLVARCGPGFICERDVIGEMDACVMR